MSVFAVVDDVTNICDNVIEWNDVTPWEPPPAHYITNIDGIDAGIGWAYNPATQTWTAPPSVTASFNPNPIFLAQTTTLSWSSNDCVVTIDGVDYAATGSKEYTPSTTGKLTVVVKATNAAGFTTTSATVNVVATQAEFDAANNPAVI